LPSLIKGRPSTSTNNNNNNNKAKCIPGGTLRVLAGKNNFLCYDKYFCVQMNQRAKEKRRVNKQGQRYQTFW
jgi:hypothetical protein